MRIRTGLKSALILAASAMIFPGAGVSQEVKSLGRVLSLSGPPNSVLIIRENVTYSLAVGDALFPGDLIFTRLKGGATLGLGDCERVMPSAASLPLGPDACTAPFTQLAAADIVGGYGVTPPGVAAAPQLVGLGITAGGAAIAKAAQSQPALQPVSP